MAASTAAVTGLAPADGQSRRGRLLLGGARTTIHVACHGAARTEIRVAVLPGQERLSGGRLQNLPRCDFEVPEPGGRPISTVLEFRPV